VTSYKFMMLMLFKVSKIAPLHLHACDRHANLKSPRIDHAS
jgi:hypothetical protein